MGHSENQCKIDAFWVGIYVCSSTLAKLHSSRAS